MFKVFFRIYLCTGPWEDSRWTEFELATFTVLRERISRTTSTTLPNRPRSGPKLPNSVISDLTEAYLAKWSKSFDLSVPTPIEYQVRRTKKDHKIFVYVQNVCHKTDKILVYLRVDLQVFVRYFVGVTMNMIHQKHHFSSGIFLKRTTPLF